MADRLPPSGRDAFFRSWKWMGISTASAFVTGFLFLAELRSGPVGAVAIALAVYFLMTVVLPRASAKKAGLGGSLPTADSDRSPVKDPDPRVELLVEAHTHVASIEAAIASAPLPLGATLHAIVGRANAIIAAVTASPDKLNSVLRFFTYYLPATADLVQDRQKLGSHAGPERLAEIDQTLARLNTAFAAFEQGLVAPDLQEVDLDIELIEKALDDDLRDMSPR